MKISAHFLLREAIKSQTADRLGINNDVSDPIVLSNIMFTAFQILEPIRSHFNYPFSPNSFYRCLDLNRALNSKDESYHTKGLAVDVELPIISNLELAEWCNNNLEIFDKIILENYTKSDPWSGWVHIQIRTPAMGTNRKQFFELKA